MVNSAAAAESIRRLDVAQRSHRRQEGGDEVVLLPYDPDWPHQFEAERTLLERALAPWLAGRIHHVGATSVPGLCAKPITDMIGGVRNLDDAHATFEILRQRCYVYSPHRPDLAHHFSKPSPRLSELTHNLHLTEPDSDLWRERLAFRDALRADPELAADYGALKVRLARDHRDDVAAYTAGKRSFVAHVLASVDIRLRPR